MIADPQDCGIRNLDSVRNSARPKPPETLGTSTNLDVVAKDVIDNRA